MQAELECLREDHLVTLRREVEARIAALKSQEQVRGMTVPVEWTDSLPCPFHELSSETISCYERACHDMSCHDAPSLMFRTILSCPVLSSPVLYVE